MTYRQLRIHEREYIARLYPVLNMARIAFIISRSRATVKREIDRNGYRDAQGNWCYDAQRAQQMSEKRKAYPGCGKGHRFFKNSWGIVFGEIRKPYEPPVCRIVFRPFYFIPMKYTYHYPPPFEKRWRWFRSDDERIRWRTDRGEQQRKPYEYRWRSPFVHYLYFDKKTDQRNREREPQWFLKRVREKKAFWKKEFCDPAFYNQVDHQWIEEWKKSRMGVNTEEALQPKRKIPKRLIHIPFPNRLRHAYSPALGAVQGRSMSGEEQNEHFSKNESLFQEENFVLFLKPA